MDAKVLVLGLDGATPELLERWVEENKLPYLKQVTTPQGVTPRGFSGSLRHLNPPSEGKDV